MPLHERHIRQHLAGRAIGHELLAHCRTVAAIIPVVGFYLQPSVGGRVLPYAFWRGLAEIVDCQPQAGIGRDAFASEVVRR